MTRGRKWSASDGSPRCDTDSFSSLPRLLIEGNAVGAAYLQAAREALVTMSSPVIVWCETQEVDPAASIVAVSTQHTVESSFWGTMTTIIGQLLEWSTRLCQYRSKLRDSLPKLRARPEYPLDMASENRHNTLTYECVVA